MRELLARFGESERARGLAGKTVTARLRMLERWAGHLEETGRPWIRADYGDVETFVRLLHISPGSTNRAVGDIARFYWWARREQLTMVNPTELVNRQRIGRRLPRPAPGRQILDALSSGRLADRLAVALMAYAGLRCLEVARIQWGHIDVVEGWLIVEAGKGGHARHQPVVADLRPFLAAGDGAPPSSTVFTSLTGVPASGKVVSQLVNRHIRRTGGNYTAHQLRHWYATTLYEQCGDLLVVQAALGHATVATTQVYAKMRPSRVREAVEAVVWH
jgi:site-specific recombinase XerD